ncbi:hypothetical protein SKAU_G00343900 [Synaphobranchus kaupii]|uniref:Uncharacterized protein n=1 Tax=Synaphobranchus kaupii TaxID=118154 RepID=A0A9Q1EJ61_SYNKA|nr:hypothetical protein SKAU_G00343900 [Synaphobranchus kaupii]
MQEGSSENHTLLHGHSDREDDREGDPVLNKDRQRSMLNKRTCPPCHRACPYSLVVALGVLQGLCTVLYVETRWTVEELQLQISALNKQAECNVANGKNPEYEVKDRSEHVQVNLQTQQKLLTVESNIARVNQYVVSLKTSYENLKSVVIQGASQTQLSSLSDAVLQLNETAAGDIHSVRAEMSHLKSAFANVTRWICGLEEQLSSHMQNFSFPGLELIEDEICNFTVFADRLESSISKGPDRPLAQHVRKLNAKMGLVHSYPNSSDLKTTHAPLARPHLQGNNSSADISLVKIKSRPTTKNKYGDISTGKGNGSEVGVSVPEEARELNQEERTRSTAEGETTSGLNESEMD